MSAIDDIRRKVVSHLLDRHFEEKEKGNDFHFLIDSPSQNDDAFYFLQDDLGIKKFIRVLFYGKWNHALIAYLLIDETGRTYLVGQFDSQQNSEVSYEIDSLRLYYLNKLGNYNELLFKHGRSSPGSFLFIREIVKPENLIGKIDFFLNEIKPVIDDLIGPLRESSRFNYYFFSAKQFEEYLASEPNYTPSKSDIKKNIRLVSLRVQDFRGIKQAVINNLPTDVRWIVFTGENGYGKTSVLQSIAAGLYGNYDEKGGKLVPESAIISVEYMTNGKVVETNSRAPRQLFYNNKLSRELATYGSSRLQVTASVTNEMIENQSPPTYNLFNSDGLLLNIEQLLKDTYPYQKINPFHNQLIALFKTLIPQLADIRFEVEALQPTIWYIEKDKEGGLVNDGLRLSQLAAGFRNIISMIGDMVYRLSVNQKVESLSDLQGIVIIDELELHLHPIYQKLLPEVLSTQFPHIQFIVSTHSPIPLLGIPKEAGAVLLHVDRSEETGIVIERLDVDFSVLTPNAILTSPIFGFKDLIPDSKTDDRMIRPEDTYEEVKADQKLRNEISEFLSPERQTELLKLIQKK